MLIIPNMSFAQASKCEPVIAREELPISAREYFDQGVYTPCKVTLEGTTFFIFGRSSGGLGSDRILKSLRIAWPKFFKNFQFILPDATIIDAEGPIGGGPMGAFIVGIYSSKSVDPDMSAYIEQATGWAPQSSTDDYIKAHYAIFDDPHQAYVDDMVIHELGHFLFGFGITKVNSFTFKDAWFALGMGIVYDRLVWDELNSKASPLFRAVVDIWRDRFSKMNEVDQRLVNPDESRDEKLGLNRLQTYGHGKAWIYLQALREAMGKKDFDQALLSYLSRPIGSDILYDDFLSNFSSSSKTTIDAVESKFSVR
jgi:hypothetical protein